MAHTIPSLRFAELHFHLLPGIDDGPQTMEQSVTLAAAAFAEGTDTIVATPHVSPQHVPDVSLLPELVSEVAARLREEGVQVEIRCGGELSHHRVPGLADAELEMIAHGPPGRRWVLLEAPLVGFDEGFAAGAAELRARGFGVVVAHPERALAKDPAGTPLLARELAAGSALQVNAWSLMGRYGAAAREHALQLVRDHAAVAVASDAHRPRRPPSLQGALAALTQAGVPHPRRHVAEVPSALLERGVPWQAVAAGVGPQAERGRVP